MGMYRFVEVESYIPDRERRASGIHGPVHIRPCAGQGFPPDMHVECSKKLSEQYPVGTRFKITAKVTNKEGGRDFLYSYFGWKYEVLS